jgi:hypothetical protein
MLFGPGGCLSNGNARQPRGPLRITGGAVEGFGKARIPRYRPFQAAPCYRGGRRISAALRRSASWCAPHVHQGRWGQVKKGPNVRRPIP